MQVHTVHTRTIQGVNSTNPLCSLQKSQTWQNPRIIQQHIAPKGMQLQTWYCVLYFWVGVEGGSATVGLRSCRYSISSVWQRSSHIAAHLGMTEDGSSTPPSVLLHPPSRLSPQPWGTPGGRRRPDRGGWEEADRERSRRGKDEEGRGVYDRGRGGRREGEGSGVRRRGGGGED